MGGAETATGRTGKAQETEVVGSRLESHQSSHQEALGGLPQIARIRSIGPEGVRP
jgi:hypothetical protein